MVFTTVDFVRKFAAFFREAAINQFGMMAPAVNWTRGEDCDRRDLLDTRRDKKPDPKLDKVVRKRRQGR